MLRSLLVAIDGSPQSQSVLDLAAQYSKLGAPRLYVMLSVDSAHTLPSENGHIEPADEHEYPAASSEQHIANNAMQEALDYLWSLGLDAEGVVIDGEPASSIVSQAERLKVDLIIVGHRHLSRINRIFDPSVSAQVIEVARCPVLVDVRPTPGQPKN